MVAVAPFPVLPLLIVVQFTEVAIIPVILYHPLMLVDRFVIVPAMIVIVIRIVDTIAAGGTTGRYGRHEECGSQ